MKNKSELELYLIFTSEIFDFEVLDQTAVGITPGDDVIFGISTNTEFIFFDLEKLIRYWYS